MADDFHPDAKQELNDAVAYYDNISREMGDAFVAEVERALNRIEKFPADGLNYQRIQDAAA